MGSPAEWQTLQPPRRRVQTSVRQYGFFGTKKERRGSEVWSTGRAHFFDRMSLWFRDEELGRAAKPTRSRFPIVLGRTERSSDTRRYRGGTHAAPKSGCLDLYTWLSWRCYKAKGTERVPLFGPQGLMNQLGVQEYARERKFENVSMPGSSWLFFIGRTALLFCQRTAPFW